jgi:hypothetical protein
MLRSCTDPGVDVGASATRTRARRQARGCGECPGSVVQGSPSQHGPGGRSHRGGRPAASEIARRASQHSSASTALLSPAQIELYAELRGYKSAQPRLPEPSRANSPTHRHTHRRRQPCGACKFPCARRCRGISASENSADRAPARREPDVGEGRAVAAERDAVGGRQLHEEVMRMLAVDEMRPAIGGFPGLEQKRIAALCAMFVRRTGEHGRTAPSSGARCRAHHASCARGIRRLTAVEPLAQNP